MKTVGTKMTILDICFLLLLLTCLFQIKAGYNEQPCRGTNPRWQMEEKSCLYERNAIKEAYTGGRYGWEYELSNQINLSWNLSFVIYTGHTTVDKSPVLAELGSLINNIYFVVLLLRIARWWRILAKSQSDTLFVSLPEGNMLCLSYRHMALRGSSMLYVF